MKNLVILFFTTLIFTSGLIFGTMQTASALSLTWDWKYSGHGIVASGTFTTNDTPDNLGFYLISGITGTRNGEKITGLQSSGSTTPGNEPYYIDNLISLSSQQLTVNGFGYSTAGGSYSSAFFADFLPTPGYLEFFSTPRIESSSTDLKLENSELGISFSATITPTT